MTRSLLLVSAGILLLAMGAAWLWQASLPEPVALTPTLTGETEYCLTCHADLPVISSSHPVETFGCVLCHGGQRLALDENLAHSSMRGGDNPSDLAVVEASCGGDNCHSGDAAGERDHIQRVMTSIQSHYTGAISLMRYSFGAQPDLAPLYGAQEVTDTSLPSATGILHLDLFDPAQETHPSLQAFGENCLTCHLGSEPAEGEQYHRFSGCAACHSPTQTVEETDHTLTTAISYTQCNTCHNRGNYDLRTMTFVERSDSPGTRKEDYYQPIAQFTKCEYTLDCADCHTRGEAMGDGDIHATKRDIQYVQCSTCHGTLTELPLTTTLTNPEDIAFRLAFLNPYVDRLVGDTILVTEKGEPLWNILVLPDGSYQLVGKATGQVFMFNAVLGSGCTQSGEEQASAYCHTCHAVER
jgi:hypothetical protein